MKNTKAIAYYSSNIRYVHLKFSYIDTSSTPIPFRFAQIILYNLNTMQNYNFTDYNKGELYLIPAGYYRCNIYPDPYEFRQYYMYNNIKINGFSPTILLDSRQLITLTCVYTSSAVE